jgi:TonB family protein
MLSEPTSNLERRILAMRPTRRVTRAAVFGGSLLAISAIAFACTLQTEATTAPNATPVAAKTVNAGQTFFEFQVEQAAAPVPGNSGPRYPDMLRTANVEGTVLAQFIVGNDGRVDMGSFKVLKSTHDMFTASVRGALAQMQFTPAQVGGRPVKQLLQMPFDFSLSKTGGAQATAGAAIVPTPRTAETRRVAPPPGRPAPKGPPQPVSENQTYFEFQVEKQVSPAPGNAGARYPDELRKTNVEGEVLAQFVVGTDGRADMTTFKVLKSSHEQFTESVQRSLPQMMFNPALVGERPVKQLVQMPFQFSLSKDK